MDSRDLNKAKNTAWGAKERTSTPQKGITDEKYDDLCYYITKHDVVNDVDLTAATLYKELVTPTYIRSYQNTPKENHSPLSLGTNYIFKSEFVIPIAKHAQTPANSVVRNTASKGSKQATEGHPGFLPEDRLREICEKHYNQILPIMAEKTKEKTQLSESESCDKKRRTKKRQSPSPGTMSRSTRRGRSPSVFSRLRQEESSFTRQGSPVSTTVFTRLGARDRNVFTRLGEKKRYIHSRRGPKIASRHKHTSDRRRASSRRGKSKKNGTRPTEQTADSPPEPMKDISPKACKTEEGAESPNQKSKDLSQPWLCEEIDPFTVRIRNFEVPKRIRMPTNVKTYDGTGDPEDHLKIFQTAAKIEQWAIPTCYEVLQKTFLGNFSQQNKYIKDSVEIHHIKQKEGESTEAFMERFKAESMHVSGAPECMRISGFMHGITNPDLIKRLNDNIPKSVDEMMSITTTFFRVVVANQSRKNAPPAWKHHETSHKPNSDKRLDFKNRHKSSRRQDRFTHLIKTPKEILAMETVKFKAPPPMSGPGEGQNKNKFCEFYGDKGHSTDECIHLRKQIKETVNSG
ncbi:hypothetical protein Tco_0464266 [Tanacetum coccineum]